ncbi:MAG: hypothetical protein JXQ99_12730 [Hyphomicrobiaceae bacterium]
MTGRFLKTIRFDASDTFAFPLAAEPDEWAISGGFAFADIEPDDLKGKVRQAFANGFLGLASFGHTTFAAVANITEAEREQVIDRLTQHFIDVYGAPNVAEARAAANGEVAFVEDLVQDSLINTLFCVSRTLNDDGQIVEAFRKLERRIDGGPIYFGEEEQPNDH